MNWSAADVPDDSPELVAVTSTVPVPAGEVAVSEVPSPLTVTMVAALVPNMTVVPVRLVPVTVTVVPPASGPSLGAIEVTVGGSTTVSTTVVGV